jgi:hypothetical protein
MANIFQDIQGYSLRPPQRLDVELSQTLHLSSSPSEFVVKFGALKFCQHTDEAHEDDLVAFQQPE